MKIDVLALALLLVTPARAEDCTRFMHNYAGVEFELFGSGSLAEKTVLVFNGHDDGRQPKIYIRTTCQKAGYICFRNIDDKSRTLSWRLVQGEDFDGKPADVFVEDGDREGLAWVPACGLDE